jgi:tryptophanyl-tRNA synthetase
MRDFLAEHQEKREEAAAVLEELDVDLHLDERRRGVAGDGH